MAFPFVQRAVPCSIVCQPIKCASSRWVIISSIPFATAGLENFGSIIVDTPAKVELGGINVQAGTLTILNNHGNVIFDNDQINNGGTINLINASLGTPSNPITVSGGTVNLQQNSSILANLWGEGGAINVDPDSVIPTVDCYNPLGPVRA